jgi:hypothetical protein
VVIANTSEVIRWQSPGLPSALKGGLFVSLAKTPWYKWAREHWEADEEENKSDKLAGRGVP